MTALFDGLPDTFTDAFGEAVGWRAGGAAPTVALTGIVIVQPLDRAFSEPGAEIETQTMTVDLAEALAPGVVADDEIDARGRVWLVSSVDRDGRGMLRLTLQLKAI